MKDLVVLVADSQQEIVIKTLLEERYRSLRICHLKKSQDFDIYAHPQRDPGVYQQASIFLSVFLKSHRFALVILDAEWDGSPGKDKIVEKIQNKIDEIGWRDRSKTIVINPELEIWIWSSSVEAYKILEVESKFFK